MYWKLNINYIMTMKPLNIIGSHHDIYLQQCFVALVQKFQFPKITIVFWSKKNFIMLNKYP